MVVSSRPVTAGLYAMPAMPDCQGSEYSPVGSDGGF
jgi:hypothetical protein